VPLAGLKIVLSSENLGSALTRGQHEKCDRPPAPVLETVTDAGRNVHGFQPAPRPKGALQHDLAQESASDAHHNPIEGKNDLVPRWMPVVLTLSPGAKDGGIDLPEVEPINVRRKIRLKWDDGGKGLTSSAGFLQRPPSPGQPAIMSRSALPT
jgi:hypothetical protein